MANNAKTTVTVTGETKGLAKIRDEAGRVNEAVKRGAESAKRGFKDAGKEVTGFEKAMTGALKAIGKDREGLRAIKALGTEFSNLQKKIEGVEKSFKKASAAQGAFSQGLAQGMGAGEFMQRGPGMARQVAGRTVGRALRAPGSMASGAMLGGAGGFASAVSGIPLIGGAASGLLQKAFGMAGGALSFEKQQLAALPFLAEGSIKGIGARGRAGAKGVLSEADITRLSDAARPSLAAVTREDLGKRTSTSFTARGTDFAPILTKRERAIEVDPAAAKIAGDKIVAEKRKELLAGNAGIKREAARRAIEKTVFGGVIGAGSRFGFTKSESLQMGGQLAQVGGGGVSGDMLQTAMAANRRFGVGMDTAGAFQLAQRQGGLTGRAGAGGLMRALNQAKGMGLEGSEVTQYLSEIAQGIQSFQQTGIPINTRSISGLAKSVAVTGVGIARGRKIASGMISQGQSIGREGPKSASDMVYLQAAGYKGGGLEDLMQAQIQLEKGLSPEAMDEVMATFVRAGDKGAMGAKTLQAGMKGILSTTESDLMARRFNKEDMTAGERAKINKIRKRIARGAEAAPGSAADLKTSSEGLVKNLSPHVSRQAAIVDKQLEAGRQLLTTVQKLDFASIKMAATAANGMAPSLASLATGVESLVNAVNKVLGGGEPNASYSTGVGDGT